MNHDQTQPTAVDSTRSPAPKPAKFAWRMIPRELPAKRPAAERRGDFREIYPLYRESEVREQASRCIQCPEPSCRTGCPLANRIPEWLALAADGRFMEAAAVSQSTSNMPELCSRVCPQERLCEGACVLNARDVPVCIGAIEKFINEYAFASGGFEVHRAEPNGFQIAVVGAGPAGLACADELAKQGYAVTVFEALNDAGGLLVYGIPAFKLEKHLVRRRVDVLQRRGVRFIFGKRLGDDLTLKQLRSEFDAVFLGIGAQEPKALGIPGADLPGVIQAIPFLVQKNLESPSGLPEIDVRRKTVAVLGGGDTAMDCLRTALRCGARAAICVYRRDLANMPGSRKEYENAVEEGAEFAFLTNPIGIEGTITVAGVRCVRMELGNLDPSGRRRPRPIPHSEFVLPADIVIAAYGFDPVPFPAASELAKILRDKWDGIMVDAHQMTNLPGVFSGGDQARGPSLVVHAVRDGRNAAQGIHRYLAGRASRPTPAVAAHP